MFERRGIHGKCKEMAQKENGQAQTPQTAQKDTLAATSEGLAGIAIGGVGYVGEDRMGLRRPAAESKLGEPGVS